MLDSRVEQSEGRIPPNDLEAEAAVLSACILSPAALDEVASQVKPEHFYADAHRYVYEAILGLHAAGRPRDLLTLKSWLSDREQLQRIGGPKYLAELSDAVPAIANIGEYVRIVLEKWRMRQVITACQQIAAEGFGPIEDVAKWVDSCESRIYNAAGDSSGDKLYTLREAIREAYEDVNARVAAKKGGGTSEVTTGIQVLDRMIGGLRRGGLHILMARPGMGKALSVDSKVLTPSGWKRMGDLVVGDLAIGSDGRPYPIVGVYEQGEKDVFRVTMDDGGVAVCCDEHLWFTQTRSDRRATKPRSGSVKPLSEIRSTLARCDSGGLNHSLPFVAPVQFEPSGDRPLDPWLLGAYLGDGSGSSGCVRFDKPEIDVQERFIAALPKGDTVTLDEDGGGFRIKRAQKDNTPSETANALEELGLRGLRSWEKFIPESYLRASVQDRIALLQGLCDTDGYVTASHVSVEFTTTSERMRDGVTFLVQSLGGRVSSVSRTCHYTRNGESHATRDAYRMVLAFPRGDVVPVSSSKHLRKYKAGPHRIAARFIKSVEPAGRAMCRCIAVDSPDHLYVTDDFILTHNTSLALNIATHVAQQSTRRRGVFVASLETRHTLIALRVNCSDACYPMSTVVRGDVTPEGWTKLTASAGALSRLPIIIKAKTMSLQELRSYARRARSGMAEFAVNGETPELGLVIVDYLQLIKPESRRGVSREQEVSAIARGLQHMANDLDVPVLALSQLSRAVEARNDKRPVMSDARDSGEIEQAADTIMAIYRDEYYNDESQDSGTAEIAVLKSKDTETGTVKVAFRKEWMKYCDLERGDAGYSDYE